MVILSIMIGNNFFYQDYVEMRKKYWHTEPYLA